MVNDLGFLVSSLGSFGSKNLDLNCFADSFGLISGNVLVPAVTAGSFIVAPGISFVPLVLNLPINASPAFDPTFAPRPKDANSVIVLPVTIPFPVAVDAI